MSGRQAAAYFDVGASSAVRFVKRYEDEGTVAVNPRPPRQRHLDPYGEDILRWIKETPDLTLQELSSRLHELHEVVAPISTIVERRGAWLLFLPPCSPDLNPMELAFSKFKAHMNRLKPRTVGDLW